MRIAITGGAGFIGSHTAEALIHAGHNVLVLDDFSTGDERNLAAVLGTAEFERLDVRDRVHCERLLGAWKPAAVLHLAAIASVERSITEPALAYDVNVNGAFNVIEGARLAGVGRFVMASSAAVYGSDPRLPSDECDAVNPVSPYAAHKAGAELLLAAYRAVWGMQTVPLRFFNVFGPRQRADSPYSGVISIFADRLRVSGKATIQGDGSQSRDFIYIDDVVRAVTAALIGADPGSGPINIARGESVTIRQLYRLLAGLIGAPDDPSFAPTRPGDVAHSRARIDRMRERLGITPSVAVADGLSRLLLQ
ncbi:MAG: NAD-dependent epimerase/dehydratase family protein [Dehalococcoidia bacterium]